jgi:hypothetical protein
MGNVVIDMSMSLDGYIAAANDNPEQGLGEDGMSSNRREPLPCCDRLPPVATALLHKRSILAARIPELFVCTATSSSTKTTR